jgi:Fe2+ or Zn2+ uptake regulation protein
MVEQAPESVLADVCTAEVRLTPQRKRILEVLRSSPSGLTLPEAALSLAQDGIGQATVYRAVKALRRRGLVAYVHGPAGEHRFVALSNTHAHLVVCRMCHKAVEFKECGLSTLEKLVEFQTGFVVEGHHLELFGRCSQCRSK